MAEVLRKREEVPSRSPVGKAAFHAHFAVLSRSIMVGENSEEAREVAQAISRARQWAQSGDYLAAIHAISGLEMQLAKPSGETPTRASTGGDVEQALGDLRRHIDHVGEVPGSAEAAALWQAAREEVIRGSWEVALALMNEAYSWLNASR